VWWVFGLVRCLVLDRWVASIRMKKEFCDWADGEWEMSFWDIL
jgi:hypothetical protein